MMITPFILSHSPSIIIHIFLHGGDTHPPGDPFGVSRRPSGGQRNEAKGEMSLRDKRLPENRKTPALISIDFVFRSGI
jgi:hypothetical protein